MKRSEPEVNTDVVDDSEAIEPKHRRVETNHLQLVPESSQSELQSDKTIENNEQEVPPVKELVETKNETSDEIQPMNTNETNKPEESQQPIKQEEDSAAHSSTQDAQLVSTASGGASSTGEAPAENGDGQNQYAKQKHAMDFLYKVRMHYSGTPAVYNEFLEIMKDFKSGSIDTPEVITRVKGLFQGNDFLIQEFNAFLPPGHKIEPDEEVGPSSASSSQPSSPQQGPPLSNQADLVHARTYVRKIKNRFALQPHIYKKFLEILQAYYQQQHSINEVLDAVADLFHSHQDLLEEFRQFLPKAIGDNTAQLIAPPKKTKPKRKPVERRRERERYQYEERETRSTRSSREMREEEEEVLAPPPPPPRRVHKERLVRPNLFYSDRPPVPKRGTIIHYKLNAVDNVFKTNLNLLKDIKNELKSDSLYREFLNCIRLWGEDILTKPEILALAKKLLGESTELYSRFKDFVAVDGPDVTDDNDKGQDGKQQEPNAEDEGLEFDLMISLNAATTRAFEELMEHDDAHECKAMIDKLDPMHIRTVEMMYDNRGPEIIEALHLNPLAVVPVVLKRLRHRHQEWIKLKSDLEKKVTETEEEANIMVN